MASSKYSILDAQDLLNTANDIVVFMQTGVIEELTDTEFVRSQLVSLLDDVISRSSSILTSVVDLNKSDFLSEDLCAIVLEQKTDIVEPVLNALP